ncbi:AhpC/TSA antioxidant enzyme-domain-containing protein [Coprinopsis sp. MPI-PUGE-AT-0042]|nr:AhpC/TSA antioxidant enzyme-domain-containing protein [Coprinopsis sp. MPI-PUGE-AT-0042]
MATAVAEFDPKALPTETQLADALKLEILDEAGAKVSFGSLIVGPGKVVVVFIRHFFCGLCQAYVENLAQVPQESLEAAGTKIIVVGCGDYQPIKAYHTTTGFKGPVYADPTRKLYQALGMTLENLKGRPANEARPSYLARLGGGAWGLISRIAKGIWQGPLQNPGLIGKQGNLSQLGGEFVFENGACTFVNRMKNTEDHAPVEELMKLTGVQHTEPAASPAAPAA